MPIITKAETNFYHAYKVLGYQAVDDHVVTLRGLNIPLISAVHSINNLSKPATTWRPA